ncbi:MAG: DUF465 domain-containing protein [Cucumibacter sp.]
MTTVSHLAALQRRHQTLQQQIDEEMLHPSHDPLLINSLKRRKLEVKDEIVRLERETQH